MKTLQLLVLMYFTGKLVDMEEAGVIEPLRIKTQAIKAASEAAEMILRIDDMIAAKKCIKLSRS